VAGAMIADGVRSTGTAVDIVTADRNIRAAHS
jgi:hypothetical protein